MESFPVFRESPSIFVFCTDLEKSKFKTTGASLEISLPLAGASVTLPSPLIRFSNVPVVEVCGSFSREIREEEIVGFTVAARSLSSFILAVSICRSANVTTPSPLRSRRLF